MAGANGGRGQAGWTVAPAWRLLGAALALSLIAAASLDGAAFNLLFRLDARLIDLWQRLSPEDPPSGEVIVVGIDAAAVREKGRWPWGRADLAELVEAIAAAKPRSLTLDILLTEPGPYSPVNLMRAFRRNGPAAIGLLEKDPDALLAEALSRTPTALAVAGGPMEAVAGLRNLLQCADPALLVTAPRPYHVECLLFPLPAFEAHAAGYAVSFAEQDLDGVVRRARAFVGQPYRTADGAVAEAISPALPVAALTTCAAPDAECLSYDPNAGFLKGDGGHFREFRLQLRRPSGSRRAPPPPASMTGGLGLWLDFGALAALGPHGDERAEGVRLVSASALFRGDRAEAARLAGRHVIVGLTRLGAIDRYTTPLAGAAGAPGVLIQALAADNILTGRVLASPGWARLLVTGFAGLVALLALVRFGLTNLSLIVAAAAALAAGPLVASYAAFEFGGLVLFGATPAIAAALGGVPVILGRIFAIRRDLRDAREAGAREEERMDAARAIQLGSLPFDADFSAIGFDTAAVCRPAQEVGGDFFELFQLSDGRLFAAVGDVSGKGLEASLVTALSKSISGAVTDRTGGPLGAALAEVSREFIRQAPREWRREKGGFVTLVAARIDPTTGEAEFAAAGCEPPTVIGADGARRALSLPAVAPLGWIEEAAFETATLTLAPGDMVAMFTDGVTEAETPGGALYGQARAEALLMETASGGAARAVDALEAAVRAHQAGGEPTDDTTILAVAYRGR